MVNTPGHPDAPICCTPASGPSCPPAALSSLLYLGPVGAQHFHAMRLAARTQVRAQGRGSRATAARLVDVFDHYRLHLANLALDPGDGVCTRVCGEILHLLVQHPRKLGVVSVRQRLRSGGASDAA